MRRHARLFNALTVVMLGLTVVVLGYYVLILLNPYTPLNPFPPATRVALLLLPSATPTPEGVAAPPTWTPTSTPTITPTPPPTLTSTPTLTPTPRPTYTPRPTATFTPRPTRAPYPFSYSIEYQTPYYGCNWAGVAGLVNDQDGKPLTGYAVRVWGGGLDIAVHSGDATMYGESGWELFLNDHPIAETGEFKVQLHDRETGVRVSQEITLDFEPFCSKSMAFIVFTRNP
ncbi:MAG TPA: hypothetical protein PLM06_05355 [Anaerolineae bacterium]|nr:hypothetical protein [Anaerolineae bacterium]